SSHKTYASQSARLILVPARGRKVELDTWLEDQVASEKTAVSTYRVWQEDLREINRIMLWTFGGIEGVVALVASIALAVLGYVFFSQRRDEFGVLHAIGHSRRWLVRRTIVETTSVVAVAWLIGAIVCLAALVYMRTALLAPKGLTLNLFDPGAWLLTLPIPLAVIAVSAGLVVWMLSRLDPVSIIERRS
ncbi:MAG TPA: ABC transporter permease, partial [Anaerolineae bacterium]|nr:ABC transporter permease [Anaerolineae bacterium]